MNSDGSQRHDWHQNGTEVDVRFLRTDHAPLPVNLHTSDSVYYDLLATIDLLNCFAATGTVDHILIDTVSAGIATNGSGLIVEDSTHFNHFHVRVVNVYIP